MLGILFENHKEKEKKKQEKWGGIDQFCFLSCSMVRLRLQREMAALATLKTEIKRMRVTSPMKMRIRICAQRWGMKRDR